MDRHTSLGYGAPPPPGPGERKRPRAVEIGKPESAPEVIIEPLQDPVPREEPVVLPDLPVPTREPELIPA